MVHLSITFESGTLDRINKNWRTEFIRSSGFGLPYQLVTFPTKKQLLLIGNSCKLRESKTSMYRAEHKSKVNCNKKHDIIVPVEQLNSAFRFGPLIKILALGFLFIRPSGFGLADPTLWKRIRTLLNLGKFSILWHYCAIWAVPRKGQQCFFKGFFPSVFHKLLII